MEVHFMEMLWNYLKLSFIYIARKSLVKRGKLLSKTLLKLILHHHNHHFKPKKHLYPPPLTLRDYEFSCSNSPNPAVIKVKAQIKSGFLSCFIGRNNNDHEFRFARTRVHEPIKCLSSPYVLGVSAYGSDEEEDENDMLFENDVDYRAEKFIESFYEQLRAQSQSHGNNFILCGVDGYM